MGTMLDNGMNLILHQAFSLLCSSYLLCQCLLSSVFYTDDFNFQQEEQLPHLPGLWVKSGKKNILKIMLYQVIRYDMTRGQRKEQEETLEDMDKPAFCLFGVKEVRLPCSIDTGLRLWSIILVAGSTLFVSITASINCQAL